MPWLSWALFKDHRTIFLRPLLPMTGGIVLGICIGYYLPGYFYPALLLGLGLFFVIAWMVWHERRCLLIPLLLCLVCGYSILQPWVRADLPAHHVANFVDQGKWKIKGMVLAPWSGNQGRIRFIIQARELDQQDRHLKVSGKVYISTRGVMPVLRTGDFVILQGHLRAIRSFCNPGGFDYKRFMALQGIRARLFAPVHTIQRVEEPPRDRHQSIGELRRRLGQQITHALQAFDPDCVAILKALILGEREEITPEIRTTFNRAGVAHMLAISGLHIGLVATAAFALGIWLAAWVPALTQRGWVRRTAALFSLVPVSVYAMLSGFSPSTQRAVLMAAVFLLSFWIGRRHNWLNTLAAAAFILLIVYPPALFSVSFQLSFAAVSAIVMGTGPRSRLQTASKKPLWRNIVNKAAALMRISIMAILGTLPLVLIYFDEVSWLGPLTNLLVVPVAGMVTIPAGLVGVFLAPLSSILSGICWKIAALSLMAVLPVLKTVADWSFSAFMLPAPNKGETLLFYMLLITVLTWRQQRHRFRVAVLGMLLTLGAADITYWIYQRHANSDMTVTALDVGQGCANLLELPGGGIVLIDGGGFNDNAVFDVGRNVIAPLLRRRKIMTIDLVVLSHPNSDHLNGFLYLLDHFTIGSIWSNHEPADTLGFRRWKAAIARNHIPHEAFRSLESRKRINGVMFEILAPPKDFLLRRQYDSWRNTNNNSLVVRVSLEEISFLFTGDITAAAEADLLTRHAQETLHSTVLFVPHHGSRSSSSRPFLSRVAPREGIISMGWRNWFGFPHEKVLIRLHIAKCRIWRTDFCGAVQIKTNGRQYEINTCRPGCEEKEE